MRAEVLGFLHLWGRTDSWFLGGEVFRMPASIDDEL